MPRAFSDRERKLIRDQLRQAGHQAFATYGLRRTSVDELVHAVGISKGAFYLFYDSKEALLLDLLERFEAEFQKRVLEAVLRPDCTPRQSLRELLHAGLAARTSEPLLQRISSAEFEMLLRRVPAERAVALRQADVVSARRFLDYWQKRGAHMPVDAEELTGVLRAVILAGLREAEIGPAVYPRVFELLIDAVAQHLMPASIEEPDHVIDEPNHVE